MSLLTVKKINSRVAMGLTYLGHELSSDNKSLTSIDGSLRAQLGHHELEDVVRVPAHHQTDLLVIHPQSFLRSHCRDKHAAFTINSI